MSAAQGDGRFFDFTTSLTELLLEKMEVHSTRRFAHGTDRFLAHWIGTEPADGMLAYRIVGLVPTGWRRPASFATVYTLQTALSLYYLQDFQDRAKSKLYSDLGETISSVLPSDRISDGSITALINKKLRSANSQGLQDMLNHVGISHQEARPYPDNSIGSFTIQIQDDSLDGNPFLITGYCDEDLETYQLDINLPALFSLREDGNTSKKSYFVSLYGGLAEQLDNYFSTPLGSTGERTTVSDALDQLALSQPEDAVVFDELTSISEHADLDLTYLTSCYDQIVTCLSSFESSVQAFLLKNPANLARLSFWESMLSAGPLETSRANRSNQRGVPLAHPDVEELMTRIGFEKDGAVRFYGSLQPDGLWFGNVLSFYRLDMYFTEAQEYAGSLDTVLAHSADHLSHFFSQLYEQTALSKDNISIRLGVGDLEHQIAEQFKKYFTVESDDTITSGMRGIYYMQGNAAYLLGKIHVRVPQVDREVYFQALFAAEDDDFESSVEETLNSFDSDMQANEALYMRQLHAQVHAELFVNSLFQPGKVSNDFVYAISRLHRTHPYLRAANVINIAREANYLAACQAIEYSTELPIYRANFVKLVSESDLSLSSAEAFIGHLREVFHKPLMHVMNRRLVDSNRN